VSVYGRLFEGPGRAERLHGRVVADWRRCRDEDFIHGLRPVSERLSRARRLRESDPEGARGLVMAHFLLRRSPRWAFDFRTSHAPRLPSRNFFFGEGIGPELAAHALRYEFFDHNLSGNYHRLTPAVDWDRSLVRELGSAGWLTMSFAYWALFPAAGFAIGRDARHARVFERCWRRWLEDFPTQATDAGIAGWGDFNTLDPSGIDICMNVGRRALVLIDVLYSGLLGAVPAATAFEVLKYLWFTAGLFRATHRAKAKDGGPFHTGNHNLFDLGTVPFCLGTMFPEFEGAPELARAGRGVLRAHAADPERGAIRADGTSWEHSSRYAWYAAGMFRQALEVARLNRRPLFGEREERRVRGFLEGFAELSAPDGSLIPYGDCQPPPRGAQLEPARSLWAGTRCAAVARRLAAVTECHAPARRRAPGPAEPLRLSRFLPRSGILVARTGWRARDSLLFVTADPRATRSGHSHHDFGSFQLWADGAPLFHDAATWAYRIDEIVPAERGYYYSAFSHNLLTVEGYRPAAVFRAMGDVRDWWGDPEGPPARTERVRLDGPRGGLTVSHRAFPGMKVTRRYRFDLAGGWLDIRDTAECSSALSRTFRQWLHLGFGASAAVRRAGQELRVRLGGVEAVCRWTASEPIAAILERSREVERAARVFRLGAPLRSCAEVRTRERKLEIACRIEWRRT
jgi:hypothetical protein